MSCKMLVNKFHYTPIGCPTLSDERRFGVSIWEHVWLEAVRFVGF